MIQAVSAVGTPGRCTRTAHILENIMRACAFLTMEDLAGFESHDHLAQEALAGRGWSVVNVPWRSDVSYDRYDVVVVRSTWDYLQDVDAFLQCLERIERSSAMLENPVAVIRWNIDKTYLQDISAKGFSVIPTLYAHEWDESWADLAFENWSTKQLVLKPTQGAGAKDTWVLTPGEYGDVGATFEGRRCMLQPFVPSIIEQGEFSLFYFDGELSHTIEKRPQLGDFRVQEEHGGRLRRVEPDARMKQMADQLVTQVADDLLYVRVDLVWYEEEPALMELELIEPSLYLRFDPTAPARFAEALDRRYQRRRNPQGGSLT